MVAFDGLRLHLWQPIGTCLIAREDAFVNKIVVTGANGFVGKALSLELLRRGALVTPVVRASVADLPGSVPVGDIGPDTDWSEALRDVGSVVHCAARVHMMNDSSTDPLQAYLAVNTAGTLNLARQAAAAGARRFVFISSIKVNGEWTLPGRPFTASDVPDPQEDYGISKARAEEGLRAIGDETGMEWVIVRPPLVYGPGVKANFAQMMRWLARGRPLPLGGVDRNRRSLLGLDNLVDLLILCLNHPAAANQIFLASDGEDLSTAGLLRRLGAALDKPARLLPFPPALLLVAASLIGKAEPAKRLLGNLQIDIGKTQHLLGWTPPYRVDEELRSATAGAV